MKQRIYDIALFCFPILLRLIRPLHKKADLMIQGRKDWESDLAKQTFNGKKVWVHCASLGEFEQGRPLIERIKELYLGHSIIVTFFSPSGYEVKKDYDQADYICYLPFDGKTTSKRFINMLKPDVAIFIKYEFWYYYLKELERNRIPTFSVSAIFRPEQQFFKKRGHFFREMLACFDHLFVQNESSKKLLNLQGFNSVTVSGDTRFDRVKEICSNPKKIEIADQFKSNEKVLVVGSSWPEDIELLLPIINNPEVKLKFIIAPHEVEKAKIKKICDGIKSDFQLYSNTNIETVQLSKVLIIDNIGMLSSLYQYGEIAYIGGAFGEGVHNILEAATFGKPVIFGRGKDNKKYQEAIDLLMLGGAFEISSTNEIELVLENLLNNNGVLQKASNVSEGYVNSKTGATNVVMNYLSKYLN